MCIEKIYKWKIKSISQGLCGRHLEVTRNIVMLSSTMRSRDEHGTGERGLSAEEEKSGRLFFNPNLLAVC